MRPAPTPSPRLAALLLALLPAGLCAAPAAKSDIQPAQRRKPSVDLGAQLTQSPPAVSIQSGLRNPFHPEGFNMPDPDEQRSKSAQSQASGKPTTDAEILAVIADKLIPSGTAVLNGEPILIIRQKKIKRGDRLSISFDGRDYEVEITDIQRTTFSLRLEKAQVTRPIKTGKTPTP
jgi:ribosomal 50S subunit-recycling heat shock protein